MLLIVVMCGSVNVCDPRTNCGSNIFFSLLDVCYTGNFLIKMLVISSGGGISNGGSNINTRS